MELCLQTRLENLLKTKLPVCWFYCLFSNNSHLWWKNVHANSLWPPEWSLKWTWFINDSAWKVRSNKKVNTVYFSDTLHTQGPQKKERKNLFCNTWQHAKFPYRLEGEEGNTPHTLCKDSCFYSLPATWKKRARSVRSKWVWSKVYGSSLKMNIDC